MKQCKLCGSPLGKEPTTERIRNTLEKTSQLALGIK